MFAEGAVCRTCEESLGVGRVGFLDLELLAVDVIVVFAISFLVFLGPFPLFICKIAIV